MSTLQDAVAACKEALLARAPAIVEIQAQTALTLLTYRVQNEGLGVPYSTKGVPAYLFYNRAQNAAGRAWVKQKGKQKGAARLGTWEEFKQVQGYGSSSVNLTYTGRMFRSLTTQQAGQSGTMFFARIVAADKESADKVGWNMDRYGDFLAPNAAEAAEVAQVGELEVNKILQQFFPSA